MERALECKSSSSVGGGGGGKAVIGMICGSLVYYHCVCLALVESTSTPLHSLCLALYYLYQTFYHIFTSVDMRRSATPKQRRRPATKTLFRCGRFELRVTKIRRQRGSFTYFCTFIVVIVVDIVTPSVSCGRFDLRCTKICEERIHKGTPPFTEDALKMKQQAAHTPDSIASSFAENDVEAHPRAKVFRKKGLDHIDLLDVLFANSQATGALARALTQGPPTSDEERDIQSAFFGVGINSNTDSIPIDDDIDGDDDPKVGGSSGNDGGRKGAHFDLALDTWIATNLAKKEFFARQNKMAEASQAEKKQNSIAACIQCLATMDEITPDQYVKACESFRNKATKKMFMQMLPNMQMHWVRKLA